MIESPELLAEILGGEFGADCAIDPAGSPPGATIRVLFDAPFLLQDGFSNTIPQAFARIADVAGVVPEQTILRINGQDFIAARLEPVEGGSWRLLALRNA